MPVNMKKYLQAADYVEALMRDGQLKPGDKLPSDRALSETLGLTTVTVTKGLNILADKGLIERKVGSGSFVANPAERHPAEKDLTSLGMLIHARADAYAMMVVKAINEAAMKHGVKLRTASADGFGEDALRAAQTLADGGCSALIIPWIPYADCSDIHSFAANCPLPFTLPTLIPGLEQHCIEAESDVGKGTSQGTRGLCEYFHLLGERRIALLGPSAVGNIVMRNNLAAYSEFVYKRGLDNLSPLLGYETDEMDALAAKWTAFKGDLAIVCYDDVFAVRFMTSMHKLGLSAPKDFRIAAWNDSALAAFADPPLTSLRPNYATLGNATVKCALEAANRREWHMDSITPNTLIIRQSCGGLTRLDAAFLKNMESFSINVETPSSKNKCMEASHT